MTLFSERTVKKIRCAIGNTPGLSERPLFSGVTFMVQGNMCCGVLEDHLVVRVGPDRYDAALREPHTRPIAPDLPTAHCSNSGSTAA
jgi:hypothetical protein